MAETYTKATIKKIGSEVGKVTIIHEELVDLEMPATMMVFRADEEIIGNLAKAKEIEFLADRMQGH